METTCSRCDLPLPCSDQGGTDDDDELLCEECQAEWEIEERGWQVAWKTKLEKNLNANRRLLESLEAEIMEQRQRNGHY